MKSLFIVLLAVAAAQANQNCTPGSLFKRNCNICKCSNDGKLSTCTEMECPEYQNSMDADVKERFCEPLKVFKIDEFNSCKCNRDGTRAMCTLSSSLPNALSTGSFSKNGQYCVAGTTFKLDECNTCKCSYDGTRALCTLSVCPGNKLNSMNKAKQACQPKSTFKNFCNTCFCSDDGSTFACTRMACDENIWFKNGTMKNIPKQSSEPAQKQVCQPLSQFKNYCNTCFCSSNGMTYACTSMYCEENVWFKNGTRKVPEEQQVPKDVNKQICSPNSHFKEQCNACTCSKDGLTKFCTMMICDENVYNKDSSLKVQHFTSSKVCEPLSTYSPDACNTCICNNEGTQYHCTLKACDNYGVKDASKKWGPKYTPGNPCTPGKLFYSECNACICSKNGLSAFCTLSSC